MYRPLFRICCGSLLLSTLCLADGCSDRSADKRKIRKKEGIAQLIDVDRRTVSMVVTDKKGADLEVTGTFTDETEVTINGRSQKIEDIRTGDKVEVYGYQEGHGTEKKLVATKVIVLRAEGDDWKPTGKGASKAASQPEHKAG